MRNKKRQKRGEQSKIKEKKREGKKGEDFLDLLTRKIF